MNRVAILLSPCLCCSNVDFGRVLRISRNGRAAERHAPRQRGFILSASQLNDAVVAPWADSPEAKDSQDLRGWLRETARRVVHRVLGFRLVDDASANAYANRLWRALETHFVKREFQPRSLVEVVDLVERLENGELHYGQVRENVVVDVMVAMGLERKENRAAIMFQNDYMPVVRYHANRFAGQRGVDQVENLAADLVLPRRGRPPKIATYRGVTPLKSWLRSVEVNQCVGAHRSRREESLGDTVTFSESDTVEMTVQTDDCEKKLAPTFREAVGRLPAVDRVLLKMLILDGVPQKALARTQGVDSGTLTRRRQRAAGKLLQEIQELGQAGAESRSDNGCLELLLAGDAADLQSRLAALLAAQFRDEKPTNQGGTPS